MQPQFSQDIESTKTVKVMLAGGSLVAPLLDLSAAESAVGSVKMTQLVPGFTIAESVSGLTRGLLQFAPAAAPVTGFGLVQTAIERNPATQTTPELLQNISVQSLFPAGYSVDLHFATISAIAKAYKISELKRKQAAMIVGPQAPVVSHTIDVADVAEKLRHATPIMLAAPTSMSGEVSIMYFAPTPIQTELGLWSSLAGCVFVAQMKAASALQTPQAAMANTQSKPTHYITVVFPEANSANAKQMTSIALQNLYITLSRINSNSPCVGKANSALNKNVLEKMSVKEFATSRIATMEGKSGKAITAKYIAARKMLQNLNRKKTSELKKVVRKMMENKDQSAGAEYLGKQISKYIKNEKVFKVTKKQMKRQAGFQALCAAAAAIQIRIAGLKLFGEKDFSGYVVNWELVQTAMAFAGVNDMTLVDDNELMSVKDEIAYLTQELEHIAKKAKKCLTGMFSEKVRALASVRLLNAKATNKVASAKAPFLAKIDKVIATSTNGTSINNNAEIASEIAAVNGLTHGAEALPKMYYQPGAIKLALNAEQKAMYNTVGEALTSEKVKEIINASPFSKELMKTYQNFAKSTSQTTEEVAGNNGLFV